MQAGIHGYNATGYIHKGYNDKQHNDKECNDKEHNIDDNSGNNYTVDDGSQSPARIDEGSNCLGKEPNSSSSPQARLSVGVPRGVYKQLKLLAHDREMTVTALLVQLIKAEIKSVDAIDC